MDWFLLFSFLLFTLTLKRKKESYWVKITQLPFMGDIKGNWNSQIAQFCIWNVTLYCMSLFLHVCKREREISQSQLGPQFRRNVPCCTVEAEKFAWKNQIKPKGNKSIGGRKPCNTSGWTSGVLLIIPSGGMNQQWPPWSQWSYPMGWRKDYVEDQPRCIYGIKHLPGRGSTCI